MTAGKQVPERASLSSRLRAGINSLYNHPARKTPFGVAALAGFSVWLLLMILTPVAEWIFGQPGFLWLTNAEVLAQAGLVIFLLSRAWTKTRLLLTLALILPLSWLAEYAGHTSGLIFGKYHYTSLLQPQIGGVPLLIPLAWLMMLPPAWAVTSRLISPSRRLAFAALSGLAFTAWDLYLDPQMAAKQLWVWDQPGAYFGIPLVNFAGWWLVSTLITFIVHPRSLPAKPLALVYTLTGLFQLVGLGVFWGQPLPALAGFAAMGIFSYLFWRGSPWK